MWNREDKMHSANRRQTAYSFYTASYLLAVWADMFFSAKHETDADRKT
ncbi:hypothetical protein KTT_11790 [Tengunoibacter tsumagoiensis]|uniref:Uncharacterized protein n=1 Tax=Tengunoibacter tsumagoiensis TaxID=2014871 RepID=A0A401ZWZ7_9CHLR|nr:hypothetical protein KTT_11790 [Tengunoibacter tsumagoiensis]